MRSGMVAAAAIAAVIGADVPMGSPHGRAWGYGMSEEERQRRAVEYESRRERLTAKAEAKRARRAAKRRLQKAELPSPVPPRTT